MRMKNATPVPKRGKRRLARLGLIAALLAAAVLCGCASPAVSPEQPLDPQVLEAHTLAAPQYPEMAKYPYMTDSGRDANSPGAGLDEDYAQWLHTLSVQEEYRNAYNVRDLNGFLQATLPQFLGAAQGENSVYSPVNIYMALALLAETADGAGRAQILDLLGVSNMEQLRTRVNAIWNANYRDDGMATTIFANSLWLNDSVKFRQNTLELLAQKYYASSFSGEMGAEEMNGLLHDWMNKQTGGLLKEQIDGLQLDASTIAALVSTVYFCAKWDMQFAESKTEDGFFHAASGDEPCRMMKQSVEGSYYWADQFSAVSQAFESGGRMWFLLPDEGVTPEDLLNDPQTLSFLLANGSWQDQKQLIVHKQVPKFDIEAQIDAAKILKNLGVTDVFDPDKADFSPLAEESKGIFVSDVIHGARVLIDEDGCKAAAYTVMLYAGAAAPPDEEVDFILDRPFVFAITGKDGLPLFIGVVNHPNG